MVVALQTPQTQEVQKILTTPRVSLVETLGEALGQWIARGAKINAPSVATATPAPTAAGEQSTATATLNTLSPEARERLKLTFQSRFPAIKDGEGKGQIDNSPNQLNNWLNQLGITSNRINPDKAIAASNEMFNNTNGTHIDQLPEATVRYLQLVARERGVPLKIDGDPGTETRKALVDLGVLKADGGVDEGKVKELNARHWKETVENTLPERPATQAFVDEKKPAASSAQQLALKATADIQTPVSVGGDSAAVNVPATTPSAVAGQANSPAVVSPTSNPR
jgi:hypothetical protein